MNVKYQENQKIYKNPLFDSFRFVTILILLLVEISGCAFFGLQENKLKEEVYITCGYRPTNFKIGFKQLDNRIDYRHLLSIYGYSDTTAAMFTSYKIVNTIIIFVVDEVNFEEQLSKLKDTIKGLKNDVGIFLYVNTKQQLLVNQTIDAINEIKQKVYLLYVHSKIEAKVNIPQLKDLEYLAISGNVKECIIGKNTFPKCVNIFNAENIKKIEFSSDSVQYLRIEGALPSEKFVESVCNNSKRLDTVQLFHNRLEKMPDLGMIKKLKVLTYFDQDFDEINLNRMPKHVEYFNLNFIKSKDVVLNKNEKIVRTFNFDGSVVPNLFEALVTLVPE